LAALDKVNNILDGQPKSNYIPYVLNLRACILSRIGKTEESLDLVERCLQTNPTFRELTVNKGWFLFCLARYDEAEQLLETIPDNDTNRSALSYKFSNLARLHARRGATESALELVHKAIELNDENGHGTMYVTLGYVLAAANETERALEAVNKAISLDEFDSEAFWLRHKIYQALGHAGDSERDRVEALKNGFVPHI